MLQIIIFTILSFSSFAFETEISEVHISSHSDHPILVFFSKDGMVGKLPNRDIKKLVLLSNAIKTHQLFDVETDEDRVIQSAKVIERKSTLSEQFSFETDPHSFSNQFVPTVLPSMNEANEIFKELNPYYRGRSECYNRAHIWSYEENKIRNLNSMKVFLFFTSKYIWDYNWNWWFHVSPFVLVKENGGVTENVIDYRFMSGPTKMQQWTNYFMVPKVVCPTVEKYSDYELHQNESYCYLIKKSMYFWQPSDIDYLERSGVEKTSFIQDEIDYAYWQGF
jgi:hypothetical protein